MSARTFWLGSMTKTARTVAVSAARELDELCGADGREVRRVREEDDPLALEVGELQRPLRRLGLEVGGRVVDAWQGARGLLCRCCAHNKDSSFGLKLTGKLLDK